MSAPKHLTQLLTVANDGTGAFTAIVDGDDPVILRGIKAPAGESIFVSSISMYMQCAAVINTFEMGNTASVSNGIIVQVVDGATVLNDLTLGIAITRNGEFARFGGQPVMGVNDALSRTLSIEMGFAQAIRLEGDETLQLSIRDDLTAVNFDLELFYFLAHGWYGRRDTRNRKQVDWDASKVSS